MNLRLSPEYTPDIQYGFERPQLLPSRSGPSAHADGIDKEALLSGPSFRPPRKMSPSAR